MKPVERAAMIELYRERWGRFGATPATLGWKDTASQQLRFGVLTGVGELSGSSVCDVGCGFGDLLDHLTAAGCRVDYTGYDLVPEVLAEARRRHPEARFERRDILEDPPAEAFDYVLVSGALNYRFEDNWAFTRAMLLRLFSLARRGVAANFLSTRVDFQKPRNYHHDPAQVLAFCLQLTRWVTLRHDYPLYEFTVYLRRDPDGCGGVTA